MATSILPTIADKLQALIQNAGFTKTNLAKHLGVSYRSVHRWTQNEAHPHPSAENDIDQLFKEHIDLTPIVLKTKKDLGDPIKIFKTNKSLRDKFMLLVTYHSNAIEGSRMTLKETEQAIEGDVVKGKTQFEMFEAINHHNALVELFDQIEPGFRITQDYILKIHSIVMYNFHNKLPGKYRTGHVNLTNTDTKLPSAQEVPVKMNGLLKGINRYQPNPIASIVRDHHEFERIHPFFDGNGRVGRILMNTQLLSQGFPPAVIRIDDQYAYYFGLGRGDLGDFKNLTQMVAESILRGYELLKS